MLNLLKIYPILFLKIIILSPIILLYLFFRIFIKLKIGKIETQLYGHMVPQTENFILERKENINKDQYIIWFVDKVICNTYILEKFKKNLIILPRKILEPINIFFSFFKFTRNFNYYYKDKFSYKSNKFVHGRKEDNLKIKKKYPSSIIFSENEKTKGDQILESINLKENNYICFATRSKSFKSEKFETNRNADINSLKSSVEHMISKGFKAVRLGKGHSSKIEWNNKKIIDFSYDNQRSDFLDLYLMSKCKFMISSGGGIIYMAQLMRKKALMVSYFQFDALHHHSMKYAPMILPKKFFSRNNNRFISYKEVFEKKLTHINVYNELKKKGYDLIENTDDEIKEATINMNNLLDNKLDLKFINNEQAQFWNIYMNSIKFDTKELIICPTFFKKNLSLFQ